MYEHSWKFQFLVLRRANYVNFGVDRAGSGSRFHRKQIVNKSGEGFILDIVLGVIGAVVGGWLFSFFGAHGVTGLNLYSLCVAVIGAIVVLVAYHAIKKAV